jgi:hypothetical protein
MGDYTLRAGSVCINKALQNPPTNGFTNPETLSGMPPIHQKVLAAISRTNPADLGAIFALLFYLERVATK